ncbi:MAG TPA: cupredoxin domain-containing protein [Rhodothermales bacterium]|nr:cupredoxin domain-containing protein [Rhodothermales bacterium]
MKFLKQSIALVLLSCCLLVGCQSGSDDVSAPESMQGIEQARIEDGVQVVNIKVSEAGYQPTRILLKEGVPARLVFHRTVDAECAEQVQIPEFGIEKTDLPLNQDVAIEFTPRETGTFQFVCGMKMLKGTLVVKS